MSELIHVYLTDYNHNQLLKEQEPLSFGPDKEGYKANEANICFFHNDSSFRAERFASVQSAICYNS